MKVRISEIGPDGVCLHESLGAEWFASVMDDVPVKVGPAGLHLEVEIRGVLDKYLARGRLYGELLVECSRCLENTAVAADAELVIAFVEKVEDEDEDEVDAEGSEDLVQHDGEWLELAPVVREYVVLAMPYTALCAETCKGLCQRCGTNLNHRTCSCEPLPSFVQMMDPRWAALANKKV